MEEKPKQKRGRKPKYNKKLGQQIAEVYGLGRAKLDEICKQFEISYSTFFEWKKTISEFSDTIEHYQAIRRQNIGEMALNGLALLLEKHEYVEEKTEYETYKDPLTGTEKAKVIAVTKTKKFVMPSQAMVKFALINIKDKEYKETSHIDHTTKGESMGFGSFLQQTKPVASEEIPEEHKKKIDIEEVYIPDHREPKHE